MKASEAVREIMEKQNVGVTSMGYKLGKSKNVVCMRLKQDNISIDKLEDMLRILDYKIVFMPRGSALPKDSYEIH